MHSAARFRHWGSHPTRLLARAPIKAEVRRCLGVGLPMPRSAPDCFVIGPVTMPGGAEFGIAGSIAVKRARLFQVDAHAIGPRVAFP